VRPSQLFGQQVERRVLVACTELGVLRWPQTVDLPDVDAESITHPQLLRRMDALMDRPCEVQRHRVRIDGAEPIVGASRSTRTRPTPWMH
jgi:hypothetical protein